MATINQFKANLIGAGPRANRFKVFIPRLPGGQEFLIKAASLPGQTITPVPVTFQGMTVNIAGDRTYETWATTVYNDNDLSVKSSVEEWMQEIVPYASSNGTIGYEYMADRATVSQLDRADNIIATYEFFNMWPTALAAITLDSAGADAVEEFDVTWVYSHFERSK
jgi:hypothetical protein